MGRNSFPVLVFCSEQRVEFSWGRRLGAFTDNQRPSASIRASAKVLRLMPHSNNEITGRNGELLDVFDLQSADDEAKESERFVFGSDGVTDVTLELITNREWIELGSQVLVMPGGGQGLYHGSERGEKGIAGLEGFIGRVLEVVD